MTYTNDSVDDERTPIPVRGQNPEPVSGWPWCLTEYEIQYIKKFNARPQRESNWESTIRMEQRLDDEADGLRRSQPPSPSRENYRWRKLPVLLSLVIFLTAAGVFLFRAYTTWAEIQTINSEIQSIERQLDEYQNDLE